MVLQGVQLLSLPAGPTRHARRSDRRRRRRCHGPARRADGQRGQLRRRPRRAGGRRRRRSRRWRSSPTRYHLRRSAPTSTARPRRADHRGAGRRCAWASCRTTSTRPGSSWATPARCCVGLLLGGRDDHAHRPGRPADARHRGRRCCRRCCRCCCRSRCSPSRSSTWCWPSSGAPAAGRSPFAPGQAAPAPPAAGDRPLAPPGGADHVLLGGAAVLRRRRAVDHRRPVGAGHRDRGAAGRRRGRRPRPRARRAAREARAAELVAQRERSRADHPHAPGPASRSRPGQALRRRPHRRSAPCSPQRRALGPVLPAGGAWSPRPSPRSRRPCTGLLLGWAERVGVLRRRGRRAAFFCVSGVVVAWAGRIRRHVHLPAALGMFFVKALVLFGAAQRAARSTAGWTA